MSSTQHGFETAAIVSSQKITVTSGIGAGAAGIAEKAGVVQFVSDSGSLDVAGMCALGGLLLAFLGYLTSLYFQYRRDQRESVESVLRCKRMNKNE
jgi:hypothetical protein